MTDEIPADPAAWLASLGNAAEPPAPPPPPSRAELITDLYLNTGLTLREIGYCFNLGRARTGQIIKELGLPSGRERKTIRQERFREKHVHP